MIIYFVSALLISAAVYKLGSYATIVSLIFTAGKIAVGLAVLVASVLLWKWYKGNRSDIRLLGHS